MSEKVAGMILYNTLSRTKELFVPIDQKRIRIYVCGPTVYDNAHIGNARPVIVFDVLNRLLRYLYGQKAVIYVRNITDIDDKINERAFKTYQRDIQSNKLTLNQAIGRVTEKTAARFISDMAALGCLEPDHQPRATENIAQMIHLVQRLIDRQHAYIAQGEEGDEVLFRVESMENYGMLSNRKLDEQQAGARIAVEAHKENPADFVLWKESDEYAPGWPAEFSFAGRAVQIFGRPGWHIECSAMSERYLGKAFDIHGGGIDLVFPHHENENAQSCCAFNVPVMANFWMHNGFLKVEGDKMSKSLGNFITVHDLLHGSKLGGRAWSGGVIRLAMLLTHYREPIDFTEQRLEEAKNLLTKLQRRACEGANEGNFESAIEALFDDLNTSAAIQVLSQLSGRPLAQALAFLGLPVEADKSSVDEADIARQIDCRLRLLQEKEWRQADLIREALRTQGVKLKDSKDPKTGERITRWELDR